MLAFPSNPSVGERHPDIEGAPSWEWDGSKWRPVGWSGSSLPSSGGTLSGPLTLESTLTLAGDPVEPLEAATKGYVDDEVENVKGYVDNEVDAKEPSEAPSDGLSYARRDRAWQEAAPIFRDATSRYLTVNAALIADVWRFIEDGDAFVMTVGPGTINFHRGSGLAGSEISWSPPIMFDQGGNLNVPGEILATSIIQSTSGVGHALYVPHGGINVGGQGTFGATLIHPGLGINYSMGAWFRFYWDGTNIYAVLDNAAWCHIYAGSDERMKQDIAPSTVDCLSAVKAIPVLQYRWMDNSDHNHPKRVQATVDNLVAVGLVAQRVEQVDPSLVIKPPPQAPQDSPLQINKDNMIALLVGAVQQLDERVRALEQRG